MKAWPWISIFARMRRMWTSTVWAPEVMRIGESYVLYYTARDQASDKQCIGAATSAEPSAVRYVSSNRFSTRAVSLCF